ncbi:ATP-binding protein [Thalassolituus sp. LLYu03]|uniref:ATP-binding protein n=1 Tax=Thalassolituus sp. LLYu03 TaxID=3421656 RepID=UPI003D2BE38F
MNSKLNNLLRRLAFLRLSIATIWLMFLAWLQFQGFTSLQAAWGLLALYLPLLLISGWQGSRRDVRDWHLLLHLAFEAQLLTGLLFFTGGATNPFIFYFLVLLVVGAYSLPAASLWLIGLLSIIDYSLLTQWFQPLVNHQLHALTGSSLFDLHLAGMWLTFVISALIVITLIPLMLRAQQEQQKEIQQLREQQLKNEQLIGIATLAAGTAHEMGTPLMTMHMILDDIAQQDDHPLSKHDLHILREQVALCRQSLQQLANSGRTAHQIGRHQAHPWLARLLHRWRLSHPNALWVDNGIACEAMVPASPLLDQALLNLLDNAAEAGQKPIQLHSFVDSGAWHLNIVQPDPAAAARIQQNALFSSQKEHGMGIGLYLSNASVEQFGGTVLLQAQTNGGSLCRISLPMSHKDNA